MIHVELDRVSPMAVPVLVIVGRERTATGTVDDALLIEAEALAEIAMRKD
jgi:ATP-dependent Lhr-like helicase